MQERRERDRRRFPRGGRRRGEVAGYSPLVFLVVADDRRREEVESILLTRHFAVASFLSASGALAAINTLGPDAILVGTGELDYLHARVPRAWDGCLIPVLPLPERPGAIVEALRAALGRAPAGSQ